MTPQPVAAAAEEQAPEPTVDDLVKELAKVTAAVAPPPEAAPVAEMTGETTAPGRGFIPPPPVSPGPKSTLSTSAEPFAAAAMSNGAAPQPQKNVLSRGLSLFERVTGGGKARAATPPPQPVAKTEPTLKSAPPTPEPAPEDAPMADQGLTLPKVEEDVLDIPAFLRRQST